MERETVSALPSASVRHTASEEGDLQHKQVFKIKFENQKEFRTDAIASSPRDTIHTGTFQGVRSAGHQKFWLHQIEYIKFIRLHQIACIECIIWSPTFEHIVDIQLVANRAFDCTHHLKTNHSMDKLLNRIKWIEFDCETSIHKRQSTHWPICLKTLNLFTEIAFQYGIHFMDFTVDVSS